jgi:hypothetical protein
MDPQDKINKLRLDNDRLKEERDAARRMYCIAAAHIDGNEYPPHVYAARQGWPNLFPND